MNTWQQILQNIEVLNLNQTNILSNTIDKLSLNLNNYKNLFQRDEIIERLFKNKEFQQMEPRILNAFADSIIVLFLYLFVYFLKFITYIITEL